MNKELKETLASVIRQSLSAETFDWLQQKIEQVQPGRSVSVFNTTFVLLPRKTGHGNISISSEQKKALAKALPNLVIDHWTADRLARVWLLMQWPAAEKTLYINTIENLFKAAEMNELVALYSALPLLDHPEDWRGRCAEGIRSNMGDVLEAIMYYNPYPASYLDQSAWNQLALKAFFTDKDVNKIVGIDKRDNEELANTLLDYASERRSAHRTINPQLWRLVGPFINNNSLPVFKELLKSEVTEERNAALLACYNSPFQPANTLTETLPLLQKAIQNNQLNWHHLSFTI